MLNWINEFIRGRSQEVIVNGAKSETALVLSGIPQGTVLGPVLFGIYINDILENLSSEGLLFLQTTRKSSVKLHRGKMTLIFGSTSKHSKIGVKSGSCVSDKCHVLSLGKFENIMRTVRYNICDEELEHVFEQKDLGVTIDSELTFEEHISAKIRVTNAIVGLIRRSFTFLDGIMFKRLYAAFVRPHLEYGQSVWPHTKTHQLT